VLSFALLGLEIAGPALASAIGISIGSGIMVIKLTRKGYISWHKTLFVDIIKMVVLAILMFFSVRFVLYRLDNAHIIIQVILPGLIGVAIYIGGCALIRVDFIWNFIHRRSSIEQESAS